MQIYETFKTIFSELPKSPKSIFLEINLLDNQETQVSDVFEFLLNMFVYGYNKLNLSINSESITLLKQYFASIGFNFNVEIEQFDTKLFNDLRYKYRYCSIETSSLLSQEPSDKPYFIMNANSIYRNSLNEYVASYQDEYEYMVFISFNNL
jgi:hypothetical protein